jgi:hypothetical protein
MYGITSAEVEVTVAGVQAFVTPASAEGVIDGFAGDARSMGRVYRRRSVKTILASGTLSAANSGPQRPTYGKVRISLWVILY